MIFDMTFDEYETFVNDEMQQNILDQVYMTPKVIKKDGEFKVLKKRQEQKWFFGNITIERHSKGACKSNREQREEKIFSYNLIKNLMDRKLEDGQ